MPGRESINHEECASWQEKSEAENDLEVGIGALRATPMPSGP